MNSLVDAARASKDMLLDELREAGAEMRGTAIRCPFHEDKHPSGAAYESEGVWRFKCHACGWCGDLYDVRGKRTGTPVEEVLRAAHGKTDTKKRRFRDVAHIREELGEQLDAVYEYTNPETLEVDLIVVRFRGVDGAKRFWQAHHNANGIVLEAPPDPKPLYNRTRLGGADEVVVVEGEKCVHALAEVGIVATTAPGGAGKAVHADWRPLAGKTVYLWADNDAPGTKHMGEVAEILGRIDPCPRLYWIDPVGTGLAEKGDAADYIAAGGMPRDVISGAAPMGGGAEVGRLIEDIIAGKWRTLPCPWPSLGRLSKALLPGSLTVICGDAGASKSFMALQASLFWMREGISFAFYALESDRRYHLHRAMVQLAGDSNLFDDEWVRAHAEEATAAHKEHEKALCQLSKHIWVAPEKQVGLDELHEWIRARAEEGREVLVIDPVTAADSGAKPWLADKKFVIEAINLIRDYGTRLILITHPIKGRGGRPSLGDIAGGAAYVRFPQAIWWLHVHEPRKEIVAQTALGPDARSINRSVWIAKSRSGRGHGLQLAFEFDRKGLRWNEIGVIEHKEKQTCHTGT